MDIPTDRGEFGAFCALVFGLVITTIVPDYLIQLIFILGLGAGFAEYWHDHPVTRPMLLLVFSGFLIGVFIGSLWSNPWPLLAASVVGFFGWNLLREGRLPKMK